MKTFRQGQIINTRRLAEHAYAVIVQYIEPFKPYISDAIIEVASTYGYDPEVGNCFDTSISLEDGSVIWQEWRSNVKSLSIKKNQK